MQSSPRYHGRNQFWDGKRIKFVTAIGMSFLMLQFLFLGNLSYIFGTTFHQSNRIHNLNVLYVDYDGGIIGESVQAAYQALKAKSFPTLVSHTAAEYPTADSLIHAVFKGHYWAAVYVHEGASNRLIDALNGSSTSYNASDTVTYIWNEARYPAIAASTIFANIETLIGAASTVYYQISNASTNASLNTSSPVAINALLDPISGTEVNLNPTKQGPRVFYNTLAMVMPIIQQFFFIMALNGISLSFGLLENLTIRGNGLIRGALSYTYTLVAALCTAGYIFAFDEGWPNQGGKQYILTVLVYWLYMHISFLILDFITAFVPMSFLPFCVLTYAITSVAATVVPFELAPGFYRWSYVYPSHEAYTILVQIWSHGGVNRLYRALPILFSWEVVGLAGAVYANYYRCTKVSNQAHLSDDSTIGSHEKPEIGSSPYVLREREKSAWGPSYPQPFQNGLFRTSTV